MKSCWLLFLCTSVFLIISLCSDCQGLSENYKPVFNYQQRDHHLGKRHLDHIPNNPASLQSKNHGKLIVKPIVHQESPAAPARRSADAAFSSSVQQPENLATFENRPELPTNQVRGKQGISCVILIYL